MSNKNLSPGQLKELRDAFNMFDSDGSGSISTNEMSRLCDMLDIKITQRELTDLMKLMDRDGSGSVDFQEFSRVMGEQFYRPPSQRELEEAFDYFDKDRSGHITEEELYMAMSRFKAGISREQIHNLVSKMDRDHDNKINKKEFITLFLGMN